MADGLQIRLEGFEELFALLHKAPEALTEEVAIKLKDGAFAIQGEAKNRSPVNYGVLRNSIVVDPPTNNGLSIGVSVLVNYAAFQEFGTGLKTDVPVGLEEYAIQFKGQRETPGIHPQPFLFPAVANQTPKIVADLKKSLEKALSK